MPESIDFQRLLEMFQYDRFDPLLFGTSLFLFFFLAVLIVYRVFAKHNALRIYSLIFFSLFFYYKAANYFVALLLFSSILNFYSGKFIFKAASQNIKRLILTSTVIINLGILVYFKYTNFLIETIMSITGGEFEPLRILLPIGISFYTFKAMSYIVEIYFEMIEPTDSFRDFTLFIFFFPNLLMGPIDKASTFIPQIEKEYNLTNKEIGLAVFLICSGLIKKYVIADYVSLNFTDRVFEFPLRFTGVENLLAVYGATMAGYCDFSGYTDLALAVGLLLGFKMIDNFNRPFKANSIADYWRRWHISLSTWLLGYLFRPLQISLRNLKNYGTAIAIFVTFFAVGLWHGPNWTFIVFGLLHSTYLIFSMSTQKYRDAFYTKIGIKGSKGLRAFQIFFTFNIIAFTSILFRTPSLEYFSNMLSQIFTYFHGEVLFQYIEAYPIIIVLLVFAYLMHFTPDSWEKKTVEILSKTPVLLQAVVLAVVIWFVVQFKSAELQPFIYFKF